MNSFTPEYKNILKGYNLLLYFAGSMVMNEPTDDCVIDFWINGKLRNLPVVSLNPRFISATSMLRESCPEKEKCIKILVNEYNRLFSDKGPNYAPAYESKYQEGKPSDHVSEFYNSYGWGSRFRNNIADDNLGIELLFLTQLIDKLLTLEDLPCIREMKKEIIRFIDTHLLTWIPKWNLILQEYAESMSYKAIGSLILACTEDIRSLMVQEVRY